MQGVHVGIVQCRLPALAQKGLGLTPLNLLAGRKEQKLQFCLAMYGLHKTVIFYHDNFEKDRLVDAGLPRPLTPGSLNPGLQNGQTSTSNFPCVGDFRTAPGPSAGPRLVVIHM